MQQTFKNALEEGVPYAGILKPVKFWFNLQFLIQKLHINPLKMRNFL